MQRKIITDLVENRLVVWNSEAGTELYKLGYYGKPLGIPKPKVAEFNVPLLLDLLEGLHLFEKGKIEIYENKRKIGKKELVKRAQEIHLNFQHKYKVYKDLR
ncbi:MAG: tRNA-intron lyase, partial [Candidatus Bathyarchaeota archaeon]